MGRILAAGFLLGCAVLLVGGCKSAAHGERDAAFAEYYPLMSDEQRVDFASLRLAEERVDFIRQQGLDISLALERKLRRGMSPSQVETLLGPPLSVEGHHTRYGVNQGDHIAWFYRSFDGISRHVSYAVRFHDEAVTDWNVWRE